MKEIVIAPRNPNAYRILLSSDIHCNDLQTWYGVSNADRMQHWVDSVRWEHEQHPIDLLLLLGDFSLDHWMYGGQWLKTGTSGTEEFFERYLSQIKDIPYVAVSGNHEQFSPQKWTELTGCESETAVVIGNTVFLLLDTFSGDLDPDHDHDGVYVPQDAEKLNEVVNTYHGKNIYLASHWFDADKETDAFCRLISECDDIKGMFVGHTHYCTVKERPDRFGSKKLAQTGNFSYTSHSDTAATFWGFRDMIIADNAAVSSYTVVQSHAVLNGESVEIPYQKIHRCEF